jgi:hypothetical protein
MGKQILGSFWYHSGSERARTDGGLESAEVKHESIKEQSNGFLVKCEDEREAQQAIA